jgi:miniconductance mechanosensitive channel
MFIATASLDATNTTTDTTSPGATGLPGLLGETLSRWVDAQPWLATAVLLVLLVLLAWLAFEITRRYLLRAITRIVQKTNATWDEDLAEMGIFRRLAWAVPFVVFRAGMPYLPALPPGVVNLIQKVIIIAIVIVVARAVAALLDAVGRVYARSPQASNRPIKGYLQGAVLVLYIIATVIVVAVLIERDPLLIIGSLGAASAVLLLVFRDTILSLVAGVQLTGNDLVRVGDWIEMPGFNADGDVIDIALNTVTVQNWDKTHTIIPAHKFLDNSFKNWRGMQASGGRRIKRSLRIDMSTVSFLSPDEIDELRRFALLGPYFDEKQSDITAWLEDNPEGRENPVNSRRLTNLGTFRAYIGLYLRARPDIATSMTFLVRQLEPAKDGIPIELYVFVNDVRWAFYEGVQADIFDHLLAIVPEFGLRVFQEPGGHDLRQLALAA